MDYMVKVVQVVGVVMVVLCKWYLFVVQVVGDLFSILEVCEQGIMMLKMLMVWGWVVGEKFVVVLGLKVNVFVIELQYLCWIEVLFNGDVLVVEVL